MGLLERVGLTIWGLDTSFDQSHRVRCVDWLPAFLGRYVVISPDVFDRHETYVVDPHVIIDELIAADGTGAAYEKAQNAQSERIDGEYPGFREIE